MIFKIHMHVMIRINCWYIVYSLLFYHLISTKSVRSARLKKFIEEAGCPYHGEDQFLQNNQCLLPNYISGESPKNQENKTFVDFLLKKIRVLEIDERKNMITYMISQYMEWKDPRIKSNFSSMTSKWTKLSPSGVEKIWHPNLAMYTFNLYDWQSMYHPHWYEMVGIQECPTLRPCEQKPDASAMFAYKDWRATLFCEFEFSSFPLDTQVCHFVQSVGSEGVCLLLLPKVPEKWNHKTNGYEVTIKENGTSITHNMDFKNGTCKCGFEVTLSRMIQPYLFQYYFPSIAIVVVSQISFIIPLSAIPGRIGLIVTQFLTLTNIFIHQMVRKHKNSF